MAECLQCGDVIIATGRAQTGRRRRYCGAMCRRRHYADHAEEWRQRDRKLDPEKYAVKNRETGLRRNYGLTLEQYAEMFAAQDGLCALCGQKETKPHRSKYGLSYHLSVDHDHQTGEVRALLCNQCNRAIGLFDDSPELLERAKKYLEGFKAMHKG